MPTEVVMPQMGESIAEGTIVRWIKKVGETVERDEPLFEISTDKVDAEVPSPAAGIVSEIRAKEGETVPVNTVVAVIGSPSEAPGPDATAGKPAAPPLEAQAAEASRPLGAPAREREARDDTTRQRSSPLVRRIAKEHDVDIAQVRGTGTGGRVTRDDILAFIGGKAAPAPAPVRPATPGAPPTAMPGPTPKAGSVEPMSVMRKKIAEHMLLSRRTSAHVHSVFEVEFTRVAQVREARKAEYERAGAKLTYLSFIVKAAVDALRAVPVVNASIDGEQIVYHQDVNIGIAVALDWGLIVPVIRNADERNLLGLSRAIADLAARARAKQLKPDEVTGGTFTITNPGSFGALFGMPIINQPQVAILGVGNIEKRPVVRDDAIAIRTMAYLSLGYDHRLIDGALADQFLSHMKHEIENWDPEQG
jgi:2-oxoglutarate dehydrogenase E2 component (dihydrolipoamide succinyltransferase)